MYCAPANLETWLWTCRGGQHGRRFVLRLTHKPQKGP